MVLNCPIDNQITSVVATDTATLLIFQDTSLKWASKLPFPPVKLLRGSFKASFTHDLVESWH